jgi:hypothetical protein
MALAPHLCMVVWPCKFRPHLPEKYNGSVNPVEFLQIYSTSILAAGGNEPVIANYFLVALTGTAQSWLMNLPEGSLTSWAELCHQFMVNFKSAYACPGNEVDLHVMQQRLGESLRSFIQWFCQIQNTIPRISNASVVVAFRQGMRDEKILEKSATHDMKDISELFSLVDKYVWAAEGRAWHSQPTLEAGKVGKTEADSAVQSSFKNKNRKKKKSNNNNKPLAGVPTTAAVTIPAGGGHGPRSDKRPRQPSGSNEGGLRCLLRNFRCHNTKQWREIKKLTEQFREQQKQ